MKIAITGWGSMLGHEFMRRGAIPIQVDITNKSVLSHAINSISPDVIIHNDEFSINFCEQKQEQAYQVICNGTNNLLDVADGVAKKIIYISSDQVFSGKNYFSHRENHDPNPINWYGFCKMVSEKLMGMVAISQVSVVRTSTLFSKETFEEVKETLKLYLDADYTGAMQILKSSSIKRSFMYVPDFVDALMFLINMENMPSLIHIAGTLTISEYDFFRYYALTNLLPLDPIVEYEEPNGKEIIPKRGGLNTDKAKKLGIPLKSYVEGIERMIQYEEER